MIQLKNGDQIIEKEREMLLLFSGRRMVISTSPLGGGIREDLTAVFNHCDMDPATHYCEMKGDTYLEHLSAVAEETGLDASYCSGLSTACSIDTTRISRKEIKGIELSVFLTAGINKNGRCAGDPATLWEENGYFSIFPEPGTVNIVLHIDAALTPGALAGALMVVTEAKAAVINHLKIKSCYSEEVATGSGTDGIIIVTNPEAERHFTQIRTDTILGEVIAKMIREKLEDSILESIQRADENPWNIEIKEI